MRAPANFFDNRKIVERKQVVRADRKKLSLMEWLAKEEGTKDNCSDS